MTDLVPCPLCGGRSGYRLAPGSTYRWWGVQCSDCGDQVTECSGDRRTQFDRPLPDRWSAADEAWNAAGQYAESLRADAERFRWLAEVALSVDMAADPDNLVQVWHETLSGHATTGRTLREAVDEAMRQRAAKAAA